MQSVKHDSDIDKIHSRLDETFKAMREKSTVKNINAYIEAKAAYEANQRPTSAAGISEFLREAGIPGIQYLDQDSRGTGAGTRNHVIFDDNRIKMLGKE